MKYKKYEHKYYIVADTMSDYFNFVLDENKFNPLEVFYYDDVPEALGDMYHHNKSGMGGIVISLIDIRKKQETTDTMDTKKIWKELKRVF